MSGKNNSWRKRSDNNTKDEKSSEGGGIYRPPGARKQNRNNNRSRGRSHQQSENKRNKPQQLNSSAQDFPSLTSSTSSLTSNTSVMSWSSIINKKDKSPEQQGPEEFEEHGGVKDWKRPINEAPVGKIVDLKQHAEKVKEYRESRPRPRYLPDSLMDERQRQAIEDMRESEYWDRKYASTIRADEDITDEELEENEE